MSSGTLHLAALHPGTQQKRQRSILHQYDDCYLVALVPANRSDSQAEIVEMITEQVVDGTPSALKVFVERHPAAFLPFAVHRLGVFVMNFQPVVVR